MVRLERSSMSLIVPYFCAPLIVIVSSTDRRTYFFLAKMPADLWLADSWDKNANRLPCQLQRAVGTVLTPGRDEPAIEQSADDVRGYLHEREHTREPRLAASPLASPARHQSGLRWDGSVNYREHPDQRFEPGEPQKFG